LRDWRYLLKLAERHGWTPRYAKVADAGYNSTNKTLFLENAEGTKMDLYTPTQTVKTCVDHPARGPNQLFRPGPGLHDDDKLVEILADPRVHRGVGYRSERGATWVCRGRCGQRKKRQGFSATQWKTGRRAGAQGPLCLACRDA
jgi:hypothetical protein